MRRFFSVLLRGSIRRLSLSKTLPLPPHPRLASWGSNDFERRERQMLISGWIRESFWIEDSTKSFRRNQRSGKVQQAIAIQLTEDYDALKLFEWANFVRPNTKKRERGRARSGSESFLDRLGSFCGLEQMWRRKIRFTQRTRWVGHPLLVSDSYWSFAGLNRASLPLN